MSYLVILAIFLVPIASIVTIKGTIVWYPQLLALQFIGGACFASRLWKLNKPLAIFLAYIMFSYIYTTSANPRALLCLIIGYCAISVTLVASQVRDLSKVYIALILMSALSIIFSILQSLGLDPIFTATGDKSNGLVSFMGSRNQMGIYSCANAFWSPFLIPFSLIPIYFAKCNSALIGLSAGGCVYTFYTFGKKVLFFVVIGLIIFSVIWWSKCNKSKQELSERLGLWKLTVEQTMTGKTEHSGPKGQQLTYQTCPLIGFGIGSFFSLSPLSQYKIYGLPRTEVYIRRGDEGKIQHFYEHAHNDLVEVFYELGFIGIYLVGAIGFCVLTTFIGSIKTQGVIITFASLVAQCFASMSVYVFHAPVSLFVFCLTLGLFYAEIRNANESSLYTSST